MTTRSSKNSRSRAKRSHGHTDFEQSARILGEDDCYQLLESSQDPLVLILDCVQDPHNLGACLRTADAVGANAVLIPKDKSVGVTDTVRRVACGAAEHTPIARVTNLVRSLNRLKEMGIWLVGTADEAEKDLYELELSGPLGLVMGAEGKGLRRLTRENCDFLARIPMAPGSAVECLNVSVAAGVTLFEIQRQRLAKALAS